MSYAVMCINEECPSRKLCERQSKIPDRHQIYDYFNFNDSGICTKYINMEGKGNSPSEIRSKVISDFSKVKTCKTYIEWLEHFYVRNRKVGDSI